MDKDDLENTLINLSEVDLAILLEKIFSKKKRVKYFENGDYQIDDAFALAVCSFGVNDGVIDEKAIIELYSPVVTSESEQEDSLCEQGKCEVCKAELISQGQVVRCPICEAKSYLS